MAVTSDDAKRKLAMRKAWVRWEAKLRGNPGVTEAFEAGYLAALSDNETQHQR